MLPQSAAATAAMVRASGAPASLAAARLPADSCCGAPPHLSHARRRVRLPPQEPPKGMLRLPPDRLECPKVEPSQVYCPHWLLVVAHQALREVYYLGRDGAKSLFGPCAAPSSTTHAKLKSSAPKRLLVIRHGQGAHNRTIANWGLVDPELLYRAVEWLQHDRPMPVDCPPELGYHITWRSSDHA